MRHRITLAAVLIAATLAAGVTAGTSTAASSVTYGSVTGLIPLSEACGSRYAAYALGAMYEASQLGVKQVRCDLSWWTVQPKSATKSDWTQYDNAVNAASQFGIKVLFTVGFTPPWARPNPLPKGTHDPSHVPPAHVSDFVAFVDAAVSRYSPTGAARVSSVVGSVSQWEIWNEPNIPGGWTPVDPVRYGKFLSVVAASMHHLDRHAIVVSGGMAPALTRNGNYSWSDFVTKMAPTGALKQIDGIGVHPYTFPAYADEKISFNPLYQMIPKLYQVMSKNGMATKKIWATEVGWPTSSQSSQTYRSWDHKQVGTEAYQAKELPLLLVTWFKIKYAGPLFIYAERDRCTNNKDWLCKLGLERTDGSDKPAWKTVRTQLAKTVQH